jgi:hypothetical protein
MARYEVYITQMVANTGPVDNRLRGFDSPLSVAGSVRRNRNLDSKSIASVETGQQGKTASAHIGRTKGWPLRPDRTQFLSTPGGDNVDAG